MIKFVILLHMLQNNCVKIILIIINILKDYYYRRFTCRLLL